MPDKLVLYERQGFAGLMTVNRPQALNALNGAVIAQLAALLEEISGSDIRCLIITGAGEKAFVAGADIAEMRDLNAEQAAAFSAEGNELMERLERFPVPTIAAINGFALGGGLELALACDIRVACEKAVFGMPETSLGIVPGYGGIQRLARAVGLSKAKELLFTGERITAETARAFGLVSAVYPSGELRAATIALAQRIAQNAPVAVRGAKAVANSSVGLTLDNATRIEAAAFCACFETSDQRMAMTAFLEKRKPEPFTGR